MKKRNMQSEIATLVKRYKLSKLKIGTKKLPRSVLHDPCPECNGRPKFHGRGENRYSECLCDGKGVYKQRSEFTNATRLWTGKLGKDLVVLTEYDCESDLIGFFSIEVFFGCSELTLDDYLHFVRPNGSANATSSHWNGEYPGSGIPRHPETLRGFMYRTVVNDHDGHILPKDIVKYLRTSQVS